MAVRICGRPTELRDNSLPAVSVVIPTYHRRVTLPVVLEPLLNDPGVGEIIVVVDGCHDGSLELLQSFGEHDGRLRPVWVENGGASAARQVGAETARGEVLLLLDDDVVAGPRLATGHARHHACRDGLVVLGYMPTALPERRRPGAFATRLYAQEYERIRAGWERNPSTVLTMLWAGNLSVRRADALTAGLHSPLLPDGYHADQAFGIRCLEAGLTGVFDRRLFARHSHARALAAFRRDARSQGASSRVVHHLYPDVVGPWDDRRAERPLPAPARWMLGAARRSDAAADLAASALAGIVAGAGPLRWYPLETAAAKLLRHVEFGRGARRAVLPTSV